MLIDQNNQNQIIQQLSSLINGLLDVGIYVVDSEYHVLFSNPTAGFLCGAGQCFEACGNHQPCADCPIQTIGETCTVFSNEDRMMDTRAFPLQWGESRAYAVTFQPHAVKTGENERTLARMNRAMQCAIDVYTEVNVQTGAYRQIDFTRHIFRIRSEGDYEDAFAEMMRSEIDVRDVAEVEKLFSPQALLEMAKDESGPDEVFARYRLKNARPVVWMESRAVFMRHEIPQYVCMIATDVTAQMECQKEPLTGLLNRKAMEKSIDAILKSVPEGNNVTFLAIDVDSFKRVNDALGHETGDRLLVKIAEILRKEFRRSDLISRMGGDEFAVFIPDGLPPKIIAQKVEETVRRVNRISEHEHWPVATGISIGSCTVPGRGMSFAELYRAADYAMYHQKKNHHA